MIIEYLGHTVSAEAITKDDGSVKLILTIDGKRQDIREPLMEQWLLSHAQDVLDELHGKRCTM